MEGDVLFPVALQASLLLGLVHGVNPCGHSWLVLAPFVAGHKSGGRVAALTTAFIVGTTLGCLAIGLVLGLLSKGLPDSVRVVTDMIVGGIIIVLGVVLLWKPHALHSHEHCEHGHDHDDHGHDHDHQHGHGHASKPVSRRKSTIWGLGAVGFVNMIVPCPTVAIMYSYSLESASTWRSVAVFASYAVGTGIALAAVIFTIFRLTAWMRKLQQPWVEPVIMRTVGALTVVFGVYTLYLDFV